MAHRYVDVDSRTTTPGATGPTAPAIYMVDMPEHPFDVEDVLRGRDATIVRLPILDWDDSLTPWPAPGLYRGDADFKGEAAVTLSELLEEAIPQVEKDDGLSPKARAICGYSLGGLFSLYAFTHSDAFAACGCLSGSVWYEGWVDYLRSHDFDATGRFAYLSIGSREKHAPQRILHCVQDNMGICADVLRDHGCKVEFEVGPGTHSDHIAERFDAGIAALDAFLT